MDLGTGFFDLGRDPSIAEEYATRMATGQCMTCTKPDYEVVNVRGQPPHLTVHCKVHRSAPRYYGRCASFERVNGIEELWK